MRKIVFREATEADAEIIGKNLRSADRKEMLYLGIDPEYAVKYSLAVSDYAWTAGFEQGGPFFIFGVSAGTIREAGIVWAMGTDVCFSVPAEMLYHGKKKIAELLEICPVLENYVAADNIHAVNWLEHVGFTLSDPEPYGKYGKPFRKLVIRKGE